MEAKKNPAKDIHQKSGMFFQLGLGISIALVITAFEWRTEVANPKPRAIVCELPSIVLVPPTEHEIKEPPVPSPVKSDVTVFKSFLNVSEETASTMEVETVEGSTLDPTELPSGNITIPIDSAEDCLNCFIVIAEIRPEPIGGYEGFYKLLKKNFKYPQTARRADVQGKVFVEFIVNRDGTPTDIKVVKGIGAGCDEEAIRVIGLTKWNPGKQRGKPVRVKMVMPIDFQLN